MKVEARAITQSALMRDSAVMMSSVRPSAKILLLGIAAQVGEGQDRDRRLRDGGRRLRFVLPAMVRRAAGLLQRQTVPLAHRSDVCRAVVRFS